MPSIQLKMANELSTIILNRTIETMEHVYNFGAVVPSVEQQTVSGEPAFGK